MSKLFWFVELNLSGKVVRHMRPYFSMWQHTLGIDDLTPITEAQILLLAFSNTIRKRIPGLKEGNVVKVSHYHSSADIGVYRLTQKDMDMIAEEREVLGKLTTVREEIRKLIGPLGKEEADLAKQLSSIRTKLYKK